MKKYLPLLLLFIIFSGACSKFLPENKIQGNWRLKTAEKNSFLNWKTITTGYEDGSFSFLEDGSLSFNDAQGTMNGNWQLRRLTDQRLNQDGVNNESSKNALSIHLYNSTDNRLLDLDFDDICFRGRDRFLAEYQSPGYRYRYEFVRY